MKYNCRTGRFMRRMGLALLLSFLVGVCFFSSQLLSVKQASARGPSVEEELVAVYPGLAKRISAGAEFVTASRTVDGDEVAGWVASNGSLSTTKLGRAGKKKQATSSFFPAIYRGPFMTNGDELLIQSQNATGGQAQIEDGKLVYHNPYSETDSLYLAAGDQVDAFMLLRSPEAPTAFEFTVKAKDTNAEIAMKDGAVLITDGDGRGLELGAPWAINARRYVTLARWILDPAKEDGSRRLRLEVSAQGLNYPLIVHTGWRSIAVRGDHSFASSDLPGLPADSESGGLTLDLRSTADNTAGGDRSEIGPMIALPEAVVSGTLSIVDNGELAYRVVFADNGSGAAETVQLFGAKGDHSGVPAASPNDVQIKKANGGTVYNAGANVVQINAATGPATLPGPCPTSFCLQDETNAGNVVFFNSTTGSYTFLCNGVAIASGTGTLNVKACVGSIEDQKGDRRVYMEWDFTAVGGKGAGTAIMQLGPNNTKCQITDKDMTNNNCPE